MPDIIERNAKCARQLLEAGAEIERLRTALRCGAYYINRLEAAQRGHVVRDLDEACSSWECHERIAHQQGENKP